MGLKEERKEGYQTSQRRERRELERGGYLSFVNKKIIKEHIGKANCHKREKWKKARRVFFLFKALGVFEFSFFL